MYSDSGCRDVPPGVSRGEGGTGWVAAAGVMRRVCGANSGAAGEGREWMDGVTGYVCGCVCVRYSIQSHAGVEVEF